MLLNGITHGTLFSENTLLKFLGDEATLKEQLDTVNKAMARIKNTLSSLELAESKEKIEDRLSTLSGLHDRLLAAKETYKDYISKI